MTINQKQFALLTAMDIPLWCDKSRSAKVIPVLKAKVNVTTVENNVTGDKVNSRNVDREFVNVAITANDEANIEIQGLCKHPLFQDILLCLKATPADVTALSSPEHELSIKIKSLLWRFSGDEQITLHNTQLNSPSLTVLTTSPALKKALWQKLSQLSP